MTERFRASERIKESDEFSFNEYKGQGWLSNCDRDCIFNPAAAPFVARQTGTILPAGFRPVESAVRRILAAFELVLDEPAPSYEEQVIYGTLSDL